MIEIIWVRLISSGTGLGLMNMCNCVGAYPQYSPQYSSFEGYGGMYPQYNTYPMGQYSGIVYPISGCGCGQSKSSGSTRGEYRVGNCLIICNR